MVEGPGSPPPTSTRTMFGGWDINKLVEGATSLVSDAQQDIASWDLREDATDASASAEPEG